MTRIEGSRPWRLVVENDGAVLWEFRYRQQAEDMRELQRRRDEEKLATGKLPIGKLIIQRWSELDGWINAE